ncbi:SseB family protein [Micromonospora sp. NPDC003197]
MTNWEPATEAEAAMRDALRANDQELYFQILSRTELLLPVSAQTLSGQPSGWGTWTTNGRTHVLAFTSGPAQRACLGENAGPTRRIHYYELASDWPNLEWWLAVNPGLPVEGYLPAWFVSQLARGDVRLPGRTMGARARLDRAETLARARATAAVPPRAAPLGPGAPMALPPSPAPLPSSSPPVSPAAPPPATSPSVSPPPPPGFAAIDNQSSPWIPDLPGPTPVSSDSGAPPPTPETAPTSHAPETEFSGWYAAANRSTTRPPEPRTEPEPRIEPEPEPSWNFPVDPTPGAAPTGLAAPTTAIPDQSERPRPERSLFEKVPPPQATADPPAQATADPPSPAAVDPPAWAAAVEQPAWAAAVDDARVELTPAVDEATSMLPDVDAAADPVVEQPAPASLEPEPPTTASSTSLPPDFVPANDVERSLLEAVGNGSTDTFLSTLLLAKVLLPVSALSLPGSQPGDAGFDWHTERIDGETYVVVFTSPERLADHVSDPVETIGEKFVRLIRRWPDNDWSFAVNPGTPVGAKLPGAQIVALANWAAELGLGDDDGTTVEPAAPPAAEKTEPRSSYAPVREDPNRPQMMQKVIAPSQIALYLDRGYDRVSGFLHRVSEVAHLDTPAKLHAALGLNYPGSPFSRDADEIYVLRWPAYRPSLYRIPYGGQSEVAMRAMEGWVIERAPFRGNGFAPGESSDVVAEFKVDSARLPHGTELRRLGADGTETLVATLDMDVCHWQRVEQD